MAPPRRVGAKRGCTLCERASEAKRERIWHAVILRPGRVLDSVCLRRYFGQMNDERAREHHTRDAHLAPQNVGAEGADSGMDPDFVPGESNENPNEKRGSRKNRKLIPAWMTSRSADEE
jgi:hypothetical protein